MKKVFLTAFVAAAFAFGMSACNNSNNTSEETVDTTEACCEHHCHHHQCDCTDTTCVANNCEGCVNEECACKKPCCEGKHECCAEQKECCAGEQKECCEKKECEQKK